MPSKLLNDLLWPLVGHQAKVELRPCHRGQHGLDADAGVAGFNAADVAGRVQEETAQVFGASDILKVVCYAECLPGLLLLGQHRRQRRQLFGEQRPYRVVETWDKHPLVRVLQRA